MFAIPDVRQGDGVVHEGAGKNYVDVVGAYANCTRDSCTDARRYEEMNRRNWLKKYIEVNERNKNITP